MPSADPPPRITYLTHHWGPNPLSKIERALFDAAADAGIPFDGLYLDFPVPEAEVGTSRRISLGGGRAAYAAPTLIRYLREARPSVLLIKSGQLGPAAVVAGVVTGTPIIQWETTFNDLELDSIGFRQEVGYRIEGTLFRWASAIAVNSSDLGEWAAEKRGLARSQILFWPSPFDLEGIRERGKAASPSPEGPFRMIAAGRLAKQKGYDVLIEALAIAAPDLPDWRLDILGAEEGWKGGWQERVERMITEFGLSERVRLLGLLDDPYPKLASADLFVHAARWEAFGNVIVEAMALGTPVLATTCIGGPHELLGEGRFGRLVPSEDPVAFAGALVELARDPVERRRLAEAGLARSQDYSVKRLFPMMLEDIARVTGKAGFSLATGG